MEAETVLVGVEGRYRGHGASGRLWEDVSAVPTDVALWVVLRWRRGKCVGFRDFHSEQEALEAVGLSE